MRPAELQETINPQLDLSIRRQAELLDISRTRHYYTPVETTDEDLKIMKEIDAEHTAHPEKGVLTMVEHLRELEFSIGKKKVRRLMRRMGIEAHYRKPRLSKLGQAKYIKPYLLRGLKIVRPNQVWAIDITYIPMERGFMYLTAIIDVYSRFIVGWGLFNTLDAANSLEVLQEAIREHGTPEIVNSDQGSQFTCNEWINYLEQMEIKISMDGKGRALDNIYIERFWRTLKYDYIYKWSFDDGGALSRGISSWISYYNTRRHHSSIGNVAPLKCFAVTQIGENSTKVLAS